MATHRTNNDPADSFTLQGNAALIQIFDSGLYGFIEEGALKGGRSGFQLTDVTVLTSPARHTLAEVSSNQVAAGVGVEARLAVALVGV